MNLFQAFALWLSKKNANRKQKKAKANQQRLERLSCKSLNVIEFNGKLYVAYQGAPIIPASSLNVSVEKMLESARKDYLAWVDKFDNEGHGKI